MTVEPQLRQDATIGFLHAGRLGSSLAAAMAEAGYAVRTVARRDRAAARAVADRIPGATGTDDLQLAVDRSDVVFVTTVDARIADAVRPLRFRGGQAVVHCSGATPLSALESARRMGASTGGLHPVQTLTGEGVNGERARSAFAGVTFGVEARHGALAAWLEGVAGALGGRSVRLTEATRAAYHASAVMAGPLLAGLLGMAADLWGELGLDRADGLAALAPLARGTVDRATALGLTEALTGPFSRGDAETVARHVEALRRAAPPPVLRAYAALAFAQLPITDAQGKISAPERGRIEEILRAALDRSPDR